MRWPRTICAAMLLQFAIVLLSPHAANAAPAGETGLSIAQEADRRSSGFGSSLVELNMVLKSLEGKKSVRKLRMKTLEVSDDGDKTLVIFDSPRDIQGTAFLSYAHQTDDDEQWLYLPALKRVKRIAAGNRSSPFMGSEFTYEDLAAQTVEKFAYTWLRNEHLQGVECYVIERIPADRENSGYRKQTVWIDRDEYRTRRIDYYDRQGGLLKTLLLDKYRLYAGRFWKPRKLEMTNHQTGKSTVLEFSDYRLGAGLDAQDFDQNSLRRSH